MIGRTVSHYKIVEELGRGGMGVVYKAEDTKLERTVALKFLPPETLEGDAEDRARFFREARATAALDHPNICTVYEIDETGGHTFISMAYIDGHELVELVKKGPLPLEKVLDIAAQVAAGLGEAHEHGIVHRDVKPSNVMITAKGRALVMDFGLAKRAGRAAVTKQGMSLGTIDYMSPEQAQGRDVDHRTDVWSFGVVLYEMVTGRRPFRGEFDQAVIYSILNSEPAPLETERRGVPDALGAIVRKCLAKDPAERYQTIGEVAAALRALQAELGFAAEAASGTATGAARAPRLSLARRLWQARVPQVLLMYLLVTVGVWQGLGWLVRHFPLSPHLPAFGLLTLVSLVPTVFLLTFFGGNPKWGRRAAQVGIPANLIASAVLLLFLFQNKDLGAATERVTVTDAEGKRVERVVPKSEFRKRIALFYPNNKTGDPADDWLQYGIVYSLSHDLFQDLFVSHGMGFTRQHERAGFPRATGSPLTLKRQIAEEYHFPHFLAGSFVREGGDIVLTATLYETKRGNPVVTRTYRGDLFSVVDQLAAQIRRDIEIPDYHIEEATDLPVSELLTGSVEALRLYIVASRVAYEDAEWTQAAELLEQAVAIDPSFAPAHWELHDVYVALNRPAEAMRAIETAMQHRYRLPEPKQFELKGDYYEEKEQMDEALENAQRWASLYPEDANAHESLAAHYGRLKRYDDAVSARKRILALDPGDFNQLRWIGSLYQDKGDFQSALDYYKQYAGFFPDNYESFTDVGQLYQLVGELEKAKDYFKKALVIAPDRIAVRVALADLERKSGNFNAALEQFEEALSTAKSSRDSVEVFRKLLDYFSFRGQMTLAIDANDRLLVEARKFWPPAFITFYRLFTTGMYVWAGRADEAFAMLESIESGALIPQLEPVVNAGYLIAYGALDDPAYADESEKRLVAFEKWVNLTKNEELRWPVPLCRATVQRWRGDLAGAVESLREAIELVPHDETATIVQMNAFAGLCCREMGSYELGLGFLEQALALEPYDPMSHLELAATYHAMGDRDKAVQHIKKALYVYEPADPNFRYARKTRELAAVLGQPLAQ